ncbi:hypothetical protein MBM_07487 [Drepanopeziza brunnea f. sp. 'multigermtubi' MB_m1]|uniref:Uncharacterized protein n=1 Tax=Marssonina brunnea f. sp. multigermtubi (strain MB_m1) TaxID=1072389 RepID=K1WPI6_MARBU|nr:uncharacterized protein MBM_07487 [Drepanopeziza brunnea f. sp. 'multigermtubi' MB_m1]EKD14257.1 hypothetical protein MBM_07487 [Drepanopeziza brunnea f. sp. 'multigermtubi' MB_m1]
MLRVDASSPPTNLSNASVAVLSSQLASSTKTADDVFRKGIVANNLLIKTRRTLASRISNASSLLRARIAAASFAAANAKGPLAGLDPVPALRLLAAAATADLASLNLLRQILAAIDRNNTLLSNFLSRHFLPRKGSAEIPAKLLIAAIPVVLFREVPAVTILVVLRKVRVVATSVRLRKVKAMLKVLRRALAPFHLALSYKVERVFIAGRQLVK